MTLGRVYLFLSEMKSVPKNLRKGIYKRDKGLSIGQKLKSVLRKVFVNRPFMRKASVLKQNKYRKK